MKNNSKILFLLIIVFFAFFIAGCRQKIIAPVNNQNNNLDVEIKVDAIINTNKGVIKLQLFENQAPATVSNFINLSQSGFYKNVKFHRVIYDFMIQTGDPKTKGLAGKDFIYDDQANPNNLPIAGTSGPDYVFNDEISDLQFTGEGILAMANRGPDTNGSQFFITLASTPWLNGKHTIFGKVVEGMEIVKKIERGDWVIDITIEDN